jgi:solute carrier family 25 phosphate transporter 3
MATKSKSTPGVPSAEKKIELFSGTYFAACTLGGIIGE